VDKDFRTTPSNLTHSHIWNWKHEKIDETTRWSFCDQQIQFQRQSSWQIPILYKCIKGLYQFECVIYRWSKCYVLAEWFCIFQIKVLVKLRYLRFLQWTTPCKWSFSNSCNIPVSKCRSFKRRQTVFSHLIVLRVESPFHVDERIFSPPPSAELSIPARLSVLRLFTNYYWCRAFISSVCLFVWLFVFCLPRPRPSRP